MSKNISAGETVNRDAIKPEIEHIVQRIVEESEPLRIIIFGSTVRGEAGFDSDVDILVIMPEGVHRRRTAQNLYRKIRDAGIPFDILVATPNDLERYGDSAGLVYRAVLREGMEVYAV